MNQVVKYFVLFLVADKAINDPLFIGNNCEPVIDPKSKVNNLRVY